MISVIGHIGIFGVAAVLFVVLWFGTKGGGKAGQLSWWWILILSFIAGSAFKAAGPPFSWISEGLMDVVRMLRHAFPQLTGPGLAVVIIAIIAFRKLSPRALMFFGVLFTTVAAGAGGAPGWLATQFDMLATSWA
ncbi:hypothetical protein [Streptomyces carpinensis]|uniref:Uncharacterized protein n=1 Tax=Streptomyces carpinensis TaxID=66369 RepID=A0ABV1W8T8_9ACTN|nr:hypothetical protein [Streptomyces carpinensis]